jgi:hypothetical protein
MLKKLKQLLRKVYLPEEAIHFRAIEYGKKFPNGFMYKDFKEHYRRRSNDWKIVDGFFKDAFFHKNMFSPFVLLEQMGNQNYDESKYILSYEAYFNYLEYCSSRKVIIIASFTLIVGIVSLIILLF